MKRSVAIIVLLVALGTLVKLAFKVNAPSEHTLFTSGVSTGVASMENVNSPSSVLSTKYQSESPQVRDLVARVVKRYGHNAQEIERTDGLRGLALLDRMDLEAIFLYEKHPKEFRQLRDSIGGDAAADVLLHWREYFGLKRADDIDRANLIAEIVRLNSAQRRVAALPQRAPLDTR